MGKTKPIIMLVFAMIIALIVTLLSYNWLQKAQKAPEVIKSVAVVETQPVVVAKFDLPWGTSVTEEMLKLKPFLKESLPPGAFSETSGLSGRTLLYPVKAEEPIFESRLAPDTIKTGGVAAIITPNKRAIAIKVDKIVGVSGFIHPGHRVDVLVTLTDSGKHGGTITKTVLENMLVLAAGTEMQPADAQGKSTQVDVITLEVTPEEGEKLALAATTGKLILTLRNFADKEDVLTKGVTIPVLLASLRQPETKAPVSSKTGSVKRTTAAPQKQVYQIEMIKGDKISNLKFEKGKE
ncbi:Flp pilus assembly protein CpaB [bacterium]|nr:Flp pilus assembly protein CpaB [bacterium]